MEVEKSSEPETQIEVEDMANLEEVVDYYAPGR